MCGVAVFRTSPRFSACLAGICLLLSSSLFSQTADTLVFQGNRHFTSAGIRNELRGHSRDSVELLLQKSYASEGFWEATFSLRNDTVTIAEGGRYSILSFSVSADSATGSGTFPDLSAITSAVVGQPYSDSLVGELLAAVVRRYNESGYGLARIRLGFPEVDPEKKGIALSGRVVPGPRIVVSEVLVDGTGKTSEALVKGAAGVKPGTLFTEKMVSEVQGRLRRLNLFENVEEPSLYRIDSTRFGLLIRVRERASNTFDGVVGYQPATELEENGFFTGLVRIVLRNLFGGGERISGHWEKSDRTTSQLELGYAQPYIFGLPLEAGGEFRQIQEGETPALTAWVERKFRLNLGWSIGDYLVVTTGGNLTSVIPSPDTINGPCSGRQLLNSRTLAVTAGGRYDRRSDRINPVSGAFLAASYTFGSKNINDPENCLEGERGTMLARRTVEADVETYVQIVGPLVAAGIADFTDISGDFLEESELIRFGGVNSVRGYRDGQFRASRIAWGRIEGRVLLSPVSFASVFLDGGYYARPADSRLGIPATDDIIYGYGVGLQVDTPVGVARFSFALGREDTFEEGKVSVGLVGDF